MAGSVNKVILIGNLGKDPEIRSFQNGGRVARFPLATSDTWKDRNTGERRERTEWHNISITNDNLVTVAERFLKKGSKVYIEGQLETRKWQDQNGQDRYTTEIALRPFRGELTMLDGRGEGGGAESGGPSYDNAGDYGGGRSGGGAGGGGGGYDRGRGPGPASDLDDEIPF